MQIPCCLSHPWVPFLHSFTSGEGEKEVVKCGLAVFIIIYQIVLL